MYNRQQQPDAEQRHLQRQLGQPRWRDVQHCQQPDAEQRHLQRQLRQRRGGGMSNIDGNSPTLTNVTFSGNSAYQGGGMYNQISQQPDAEQRHFQRQLRHLRRRNVQLLQQQPDDPEQHHMEQPGQQRPRHGQCVYPQREQCQSHHPLQPGAGLRRQRGRLGEFAGQRRRQQPRRRSPLCHRGGSGHSAHRGGQPTPGRRLARHQRRRQRCYQRDRRDHRLGRQPAHPGRRG